MTTYPCPACNKKFEDKSAFVVHMKGTHGESGETALARAKGIEDPEFGNSFPSRHNVQELMNEGERRYGKRN